MAIEAIFTLNLNDWGNLTALSHKLGYKNWREFITDEMLRVAKTKKLKRNCEQSRRKKRNNITIPNECRDFYENLACNHSAAISTTIFRYVMLPHLITQQQIHLVNKELKLAEKLIMEIESKSLYPNHAPEWEKLKKAITAVASEWLIEPPAHE